MLNIKVDNTAVLQALEAISRAARSSQPLMRTIAGHLLDSTETAFDEETSPESGEPWPKLQTAYAAWKKKHGYSSKMLELYNDLKPSMVVDYGDDYAAVGSNKPHSGTHQFGNPDKNIPAREYLGMDELSETEILEAIRIYFERALD